MKIDEKENEALRVRVWYFLKEACSWAEGPPWQRQLADGMALVQREGWQVRQAREQGRRVYTEKRATERVGRKMRGEKISETQTDPSEEPTKSKVRITPAADASVC